MTPDEALQFFSERKVAYQLAFGSQGGKTVLADMTAFCRGKDTCVVPGDRDRTMVLEGRREVYLRVMDHLELTPDELVAKYTRPDPKGAISHNE